MSLHFLGETADIKKAKTFILPVPYEASTTYGTNTKMGPAAIIAASQHLELYDDELKTETATSGIFTGAPLKPNLRKPELTVDRIQQATEKIIKSKKFPVLLGGEHTITIGAVKAAKKFYPDLSVLQFDAHADLRNTYQQNHYSHACVMHRVRQFVHQTVAVGIRSYSQEEVAYLATAKNCRIHGTSKENLKIEKILSGLSRNVYLTFDLDVFDPAIMPSVGTPEPGGLWWDETLGILKAVCGAKCLVACDVVELTPIPGLIHADFLAAKLVYKLIGYKQRLK